VPRALSIATACLVLSCQRPSPPPGRLIDDAGVSVAVPTDARRIVSLIPATTELVFALGAGSRLVGRTTWCDFPAEARAVPDLGNGLEPNLEAVVGVRPDLVLLYRSASNRMAADRLRALGIPVLELLTDRTEDLFRVTRLLGAALGFREEAESLLATVRQQLDSATAPDLSRAQRPSVLLLTWDRPPIVLGVGSFLSEIVDRAGARNAFDDVIAPSAPVSLEAVVRRDPDWVLTTSGGEPAVAGHPEWRAVRAVREHRFLTVQGSEFNRPSPRIGSAVRELRLVLERAAAARRP